MTGKVIAVVLAGGIGERIESHIPKQFLKVAGKTLLEHAIEVFEHNKNVNEIIVVTHPEFRAVTEETISKNKYAKTKKVVDGGNTRRESSFAGIKAIADDEAKVLIHDAVRPFVTDRIIDECIGALDSYKAVDVAIPSPDTIIKITQAMLIDSIPVRRYMMRGQTPQAFKVGVIKKAHELAAKDKNDEFTDDCALVLKYRLADVYVVKGEEKNIKVTYAEDLYLADKLFQLKSRDVPKTIALTGLKNKVIVIFGASRGIGESILKTSRSYGAIAYGFSPENGVDIRSPGQIEKALQEVYQKEKKIDFIAVTAGVLRKGEIETRGIDDIKEEVDINYIGSINAVKAGIGYMKKSKGSMILFTSSSYTRGRALYSVYSSTKAAIVNLAQGMAEELSGYGVRINVMNPERTATPMRKENFGEEPEDTLLKPEQVAQASLKTLLSDLTGEVVDVRKDY